MLESSNVTRLDVASSNVELDLYDVTLNIRRSGLWSSLLEQSSASHSFRVSILYGSAVTLYDVRLHNTMSCCYSDHPAVVRFA